VLVDSGPLKRRYPIVIVAPLARALTFDMAKLVATHGRQTIRRHQRKDQILQAIQESNPPPQPEPPSKDRSRRHKRKQDLAARKAENPADRAPGWIPELFVAKFNTESAGFVRGKPGLSLTSQFAGRREIPLNFFTEPDGTFSSTNFLKRKFRVKFRRYPRRKELCRGFLLNGPAYWSGFQGGMSY